MIMLDTHVLVWLSEGSLKLGKTSVKILDEALKLNDLYVSTISFWEVAMLVDKGRIDLSMEVDVWRRSLIKGGLQEVNLSGNIAIEAASLKNFHGDPADRIIVASSLNAAMILCTADKKILEWQNELQRVNAKH